MLPMTAGPQKPAKPDDRNARLAKALRDNLRKRKEQERARDDQPAPSDPGSSRAPA
ncbi:hypothetical protein [Oleisolibacter albus]|uniref:hypothetical protein n=1 Tax=Oleisolibacter albus TaxID=2171757 RepID=UPI0012D7625C|nr:hypothetical protein [Oleisolibacter albus]